MLTTTIGMYLIAAILQGLALPCPRKHARWLVMLFGLIAVCMHALLLHRWIDLRIGQDLGFFNLLSLTLWLVSVLIIVTIMFRSVEILAVIVFPATALSILLVHYLPQAWVVITHSDSKALFHVILSILTAGTLMLAALIACLLWLQDLLVRISPNHLMLHKLPPLLATERLLFSVISFGFVLLTVLLVSSLYFYHEMLLNQVSLWPKTVLVVTAWLIFSVLLIGRYQFGWRGRKAIIATLLAVVLLVGVYFGSTFLMSMFKG